ncbi:MAG: 30S ribosomal protein S17 [Proteobacteria bacterium]|nr:30S ribosomal protein S17 [Pseudomonadota bacterium]
MPRRVLEGKVVSDKCDKTVTVIVERRVRDANYGKIIRRSEKYAAHDEGNAWKIGDKVRIEECRPLSKSKRWRVISGEASGESRAKTVDDLNHGKVSVKKVIAEPTVAKKEAKAEKKPAAKKDK